MSKVTCSITMIYKFQDGFALLERTPHLPVLPPIGGCVKLRPMIAPCLVESIVVAKDVVHISLEYSWFGCKMSEWRNNRLKAHEDEGWVVDCIEKTEIPCNQCE